MAAVMLQSVAKRFGGTVALEDVNLSVSDGELFFLLGPSGCGKTTLLRALAGFCEPDRGRIFFGDRDVTQLPPQHRGCALVFQNYALWPHLTVRGNVAYGLRVRGLPAGERKERVREVLRLVRLGGLEDRRPNELSGGQQQRVALARSLVVRPSLLLLDEPLSNLDAKLRLEMRLELKRIHREARVTAIYVTHDRDEALSMADRIAVMRAGRVLQVGAPRELYMHPASRFVAGFLGEANFVEGNVAGIEGNTVTVVTEYGVLLGSPVPNLSVQPAGAACGCVRPEKVKLLAGDATADNTLSGTVRESIYLGESEQVLVETPGGVEWSILRLGPGQQPVEPGEEVRFGFDAEHLLILPPEGV